MSNLINPMAVSGVQNLVERAYRESGEFQYLRELLMNALEAGAKRIEFGPEWRAVEREQVYRLMVADDGKGMNADEMRKFLNTFGGGGKPIGDAHENYGVGAKTSLVPWNHHGVVVLSWSEESPEGAMIWLMRDPVSGEYGARKFKTDDGSFDDVVVPFGEWAEVKPDWIAPHGTVVVCLGNTGKEDTFLGKAGDGDVKRIAAYLNKRLWEVPEGVEIVVQELRSTKRNAWPRNLAEAQAAAEAGEIDRRWNRRTIRGAAHYVMHAESGASGKLGAKGTVTLGDGTAIDWYLWDGERPKVHSYAHKTGYIAALYRNELYDTQQHIAHFRSFGVTQRDVKTNLTLIARPPQTDGTYGVYPDTARNALKIQGSKRAGEPLPWADWAQEFAENMPQEIAEAMAKAGPKRSGTLEDSSWRKRLIDRFGSRWKTLRLVFSKSGKNKMTPTDGPVGPTPTSSKGGSGGGSTQPSPNTGGTRAPRSAKRPDPQGQATARCTSAPGGLPDYEWVTAADLDESEAFAAAWAPPSASRPHGLVQLARDFPAFQEVKKFWRDQYPDHLGDQIDESIEEVYGQTMVARVAHSEALLADAKWGRTRVDNELRTPAALTMSALGLLSEDAVISNRLKGLGVRRRAS